MFNDLLREIDDVQSSLEFSRRFIKTLEIYRERLISKIEIAQNAINSLKEDGGKLQAQIVESILIGVKEDAKFILQSEIIEAVRKNREFAFPLFLTALLEVADHPEIFSFRIIGTGKNTKIRADIELEGYAGSLADWATGVIETRRELKLSRGPDAEKASRIWRERIYQNPTAPYYETIRTRIEKSNKPAAFWSLLDKGSTTLASDRGGTAYPSYTTPTNFLDKAKTKIERQFKTQFDQSFQQTDKSREELQKELNLANSYLAQIDSTINQISVEIEKNRELYNKFSKVSTYIDQNKLDNVLARIRLGLDVNVTAEGRVELGVSGRRYRPYLSRLQAITGGY